MEIQLSQIWAKTEPFQSVLTHGALAGIVAQVIWDQMLVLGVRARLCAALDLDEAGLRRWVGYLASLHDIGKVEGCFQSLWPEMLDLLEANGLRPPYINGKIRHEETTRQILLNVVWKETEDKSARKFYASILAAHHQGKRGDRVGKLVPGEGEDPFWTGLQRELEGELRRRFLQTDTLALPPARKEERGAVGALLLGIVILADWIASSDFFADGEDWLYRPDGWRQAEERAVSFLRLSGLARQGAEFGETFSQVWPNIPPRRMRGLQEEVEALFRETEEKVSLVLLEAPMGEGKTEAGIYAALQMARQWGKEGFYIGLPTAATANQMVGRVRAFLAGHQGGATVRLLHSAAWLAEEAAPDWRGLETEEERCAAGWLLPTRRGLLGSYAVGTVDQVMMSVLMIKYGVLRLLGLAEKVLVIDELHAYDVYMSEILKRLLAWCQALEIPVVLLSATLPPEKKREMLADYAPALPDPCYPAVTAITPSGKVLVRPVSRTRRRQTVSVELRPLLHREEEIVRLAAELVAEGGCLCVLLNTVGQAQAVYQALERLDFDGERLLFHARFPGDRRGETEERCIRLFGKDKTHRPQRAILVATQVVEQSLDVDFDGMISAVAPMDLLFQRMGRMFRHEDTPRPTGLAAPRLFVLTSETPGDFGVDGYVYPPCLLRQSIRLLEGRAAIRVPEDLPELVAMGYDPAQAPPEELESWMERLLEDQVKAAVGASCLIGEPEKGFAPLKEPEQVVFDDLEQSGYLSAKTRLGEPTARIVLLPEEEFRTLWERGEKKVDGRRALGKVTGAEARRLLTESVAVRSKLLGERAEDVLWGEGMLSGLELYPGTPGADGAFWYRQKNGRRLVVHPVLGVLWREEKEADAHADDI